MPDDEDEGRGQQAADELARKAKGQTPTEDEPAEDEDDE